LTGRPLCLVPGSTGVPVLWLVSSGLCFESQRADAIVGVFLPRWAVLWFEVDIVVQVMDAAVIERFFVAVHVSQMDVAAGIFRAHFMV
jgi:hypothetical protein